MWRQCLSSMQQRRWRFVITQGKKSLFHNRLAKYSIEKKIWSLCDPFPKNLTADCNTRRTSIKKKKRVWKEPINDWMHLQTGERGHLRFQHTGHTGFSATVKPCCRGLPLIRPVWAKSRFSQSTSTGVCPSGFCPHGWPLAARVWVGSTKWMKSRKTASEVEDKKKDW